MQTNKLKNTAFFQLGKVLINSFSFLLLVAICFGAGLKQTAAQADFQITSLTANNATAIEHEPVTNDDRGGIAVSTAKAFYTGDGTTGRFDISNLANGAALSPPAQYDGLVSNVRTGTFYSLGTATGAISTGGSLSFNGTVTRLLELDGTTGALNGNQITLSTPVTFTGSFGIQAGIFAGYDGVVLLNNDGTVYNIDLPSGTVTNLGNNILGSPSI